MNGFDFSVEIVRTDRKKSTSIHLEGDGIRVRVPKGLSERRIRDLIARRIPWITTKLKESAAYTAPRPKEYINGEAFSYLGRNYRLKISVGEDKAVKLRGGYLQTQVPATDLSPGETVRHLLTGWYRQHAQLRLEEKTERFARIIGVRPKSVRIRDYKSRWGSCSASGNVSYNWRIILAPHRIVDYVVVHELCHLLEHNHSKRYWQHVEYCVPDYRERRHWLKTEAGRLVV